jgi:hypothetical protein
MRVIITFIVLFFATALYAQTPFLGFTSYPQRAYLHNDIKDSTPHSKWFVSKYAGTSTGFSFYKGGNAMFFSVPVGLRLNRTLSNNLYAFAGVYAAPTYVNFNHAFLSADVDKTNPNNRFLKSGYMSMYSRADIGLMYVNDAKTFSISGSIGIERSTYPLLPYYPVNTSLQNSVAHPVHR